MPGKYSGVACDPGLAEHEATVVSHVVLLVRFQAVRERRANLVSPGNAGPNERSRLVIL
jgi:hypothetical protein